MPSSPYRRILQTAMRGGGDPAERCAVLTRLCAEELAVAGVGVSLTSSATHRPETIVAATEGLATVLESCQYDLGEGPSSEATAVGRPVLHPHLGTTGLAAWPRFGRAALDSGCQALFAFPVQIGLIRLGALTLYGDHPRSLTDDEFALALEYAEVALAVVLAGPNGDSPEADAARSADGWMGDHLEVHQATGMVSERLGIGLVDALLVLRAHAYSHHHALVDVARDVVARRLFLDGSDET